ncbi:MAG: ThiF family adenylyltransferase [Myxococcales bacterium]|nr:ThiF family adenylyltransferase [Myxococcales bacterium]
MRSLADSRVLLLGAGGLGSIAGLVLARSGIGQITVVDQDRVDLSNLHRQLLYTEADQGQGKAALAADRLAREAHKCGNKLDTVAREIHAVPDTIGDLIEGHDLIVEGTDNFASKFMTADAARLAGVPVVHAGAVRWVGWALGSSAHRGPCLRCVFEDIPTEHPETCAAAGVVGPVVGVLGALQARLALQLLGDQAHACRTWYSYQALGYGLRQLRAPDNPGCPLCAGHIQEMNMARYVRAACATEPVAG